MASTTTIRAPGFRRVLPGTLAAAMAALLAAACETHTGAVHVSDHDYRQRHPILIAEDPEVLDIPVGMKAGELSPQIAQAIYGFVADYRRNGTGALTIQVPSASANETAAASAAHDARRILLRAGVPPSHLRVAPYHFGDFGAVAPLRLSFLKIKAVAPQCGLWPEDTTANGDNSNYFNFGCANQANTAAMIADPGDLVAPRAMDPPSGARRATVIEKYSKGEDTRSQTELLGNSIGGF
jgi:pilus assembly protein CpaD